MLTPGPWTALEFQRAPTDSKVKLYGYHVKAADGTVIAEAYPQPWPVAINKTNATVLAAAPEMLAALKLAIQGLDTDGPASAIAALNTYGRAAIAKAEPC